MGRRIIDSSAILPRVPNTQNGYRGRLLGVRRQHLVMKLVPPGKANPTMHFARRRAVIAVEFFAESMEMVLAQPLCLVQQSVHNTPRNRGVVVLLDVSRYDTEIGHRFARRHDLDAHVFGTGNSLSVPRLSAHARACSIVTVRPADTSSNPS